MKYRNIVDIINYLGSEIFKDNSDGMTPDEYQKKYETSLRNLLDKNLIDFSYLELDLAALNSITDLAKFKLQIREQMAANNISEDNFAYCFIDALLWITSQNFINESNR